MNLNPAAQYDDIKKIQSFFIIITSPSKQKAPRPSQQQSKILTRSVLQDFEEDKQKNIADGIDLQLQSRNGGNSVADRSLKKIQYKTRLNENMQRHAQMKEKCQILIHYSPYKARHASTGCLRSKNQMIQQSHLKVQDFYKSKLNQNTHINHGTKRLSTELHKFVDLPQLKINPYLLTLNCDNVEQKFYLVKTIKSTEKHSIYLAQNVNNKTIYTLKIVKKSLIRKEQLDKLIKQLKIQSYLSHVNLVKLLHITYDKHFLYLFYEPSMMTNHNLGEQIKQGGPLFQRQVRRIIKQICLAVQYLQKNNIVHKNIRPQSIYCQEGIVKLGNFNKAEYIGSRLSSKSKSQDSLKWSISRFPFTDSKIDIWNIGFLTYQLLFGRTLIVLQQGISLNKITKQSLQFSQDVDVSNTAKEFISSCLQRHQGKRMGIRQAMQHGFLKGGDKYRWTTS